MNLKLLKFGQEIDAADPKNGTYYVIIEIGGIPHRLSANQEVIQALIETVYSEKADVEDEDLKDPNLEPFKEEDLQDWEGSEWDTEEDKSNGSAHTGPQFEDEVPSI